MALQALFAQLVVSDGEAAETFWSAVFGRGPDSRPMGGLVEWHWPSDAERSEGVHPSFGVQVFVDPDRAGRSNATGFDDDLDATLARLDAAGIASDGPTPGGGARTLAVTDPEGNRFVYVG